MIGNEKILDHFANPRNVGSLDSGDPDVGTGIAGTVQLGTLVKLQIRINAQGLIETVRFKTYGCGFAIACSSLLGEWLKGKTLEEADAIAHAQLAEELALPPAKLHCAVLAVDACKAALGDYRAKRQSNGQFDNH